MARGGSGRGSVSLYCPLLVLPQRCCWSARGAEPLSLTVGDFSLLQLVNTESHGALTSHDTHVMTDSSAAVKCRPDAGL